MILQDLNKRLDELSKHKSRESLLEFAYALTEWMGLETTANKVPQLLAPKTQKLKDFLVPAPQTVQPQLYRLNADNQNIRIRFAVLKKIKKEYLSQLVDNDPGAESFQNTPDALRIITKAPYFVHFVTTHDYDRLVLIFNHGDQKRIVSFRNRLTNTQYNKIILDWQNIAGKSKNEIADLLWKSLDIKEVNKEFYKQIKERFDALLGIVKTQHSTATDNQIKQFTVRLIGRYIFCWFLKEKGIISQNLIGKKTIEETENYYQSTLLKLFFQTLNTKVQDRNPLTHEKLFEKIPYLNGGLFDESDEDKLFQKLNLDAWLLPFVEILESYDFTVDESSSQYQQVAVDPEMLGRIFENLLASQNEDTEKLANQRKAFGAFYTPREIVDYMVVESIKAYLQTNWEQHIISEKTNDINNPKPVGDIFGNKKPQQLAIETKRYELKEEDKQKIEKVLSAIFSAQPNTDGLKKEDKSLLLKFLEQIKILDPACGSGAFPMGVLHKLVELNELLGTVKSSYELKKDILSQNIYGVDIMPMAIEIARLRAWLSLVLEEEYKPNDNKHNFGVKPLPNLDFKFVCANSLIDLGLDAFMLTNHAQFNAELVSGLKDLETLRKGFFTPDLNSTEKEMIKKEYLEKRDVVIEAIETEKGDKVLVEIAKKIKNWNPFDDSYASSFFSPTWMFGIDKGFDIIIGNPPYVTKLTDKEVKYFQSEYDTIQGKKYDLFRFFIEKCIKLNTKNGILIFIVPDVILNLKQASLLREYILNNCSVKQVLKAPLSTFTASVEPIIIVLKKEVNIQNNARLIDIVTLNTIASVPQENWRTKPDINFEFSNIKNDNEIIDKIKKLPLKISDVSIWKKGLGVYSRQHLLNKFSFDEVEKIMSERPWTKNTKVDDSFGKEILGKDISRYSLKWNEKKWLSYGPWLAFQRPIEFFKGPRLLVREITLDGKYNVAATYEENEYFNNQSIFNGILKSEKNYSLKFLLGLINSRLFSYYVLATSPKSNRTLFPTILMETIELFPLKETSEIKQKSIIESVDKILKLKQQKKDISPIEKEIDVFIYKLYEITYDEVKIIDKDFWLSEAEYVKF